MTHPSFKRFLPKLSTISFFVIKGSLYQQVITLSPSKCSFRTIPGFLWNRIAEAIMANFVLKLTINYVSGG